MWPRSPHLQPANAEYLAFRQKARETAFTLESFGETEITKYDLDTADIKGGKYNDRTYEWDRPLEEEEAGTDIRTLDRH